MIKTFYKKRPTEKIFFEKGIKVKSYAYGEAVHNEFVEWRKSFVERWNKSNANFLLLERGDIGANTAKMDASERLVVAEPKGKKLISRKHGSLAPLWFEGMYMELSRDGDLFINGEKHEHVFGEEIKAWGVTAIWRSVLPEYTMFVLGKDEGGDFSLRAYPFDLKTGPSAEAIASTPIPPTLNKKSSLYCFGKHIFLVHESRLYYYYYNTERSCLEEVALKSDISNTEKDFCQNVSNPVVCDSSGSVHWLANNCVYSFSIGYPQDLSVIDLGQRNEGVSVQCFKGNLYIYRKNKITREFSCLQYKRDSRGEYDGCVFNQGAKYNMFFADKNGMLFYLKIPNISNRAYVIKNSLGKESTVGEVDISSANGMFCINGNLYLGCDYAGNQINN